MLASIASIAGGFAVFSLVVFGVVYSMPLRWNRPFGSQEGKHLGGYAVFFVGIAWMPLAFMLQLTSAALLMMHRGTPMCVLWVNFSIFAALVVGGFVMAFIGTIMLGGNVKSFALFLLITAMILMIGSAVAYALTLSGYHGPNLVSMALSETMVIWMCVGAFSILLNLIGGFGAAIFVAGENLRNDTEKNALATKS